MVYLICHISEKFYERIFIMIKKIILTVAAVCTIAMFTACSSCEIGTGLHNQKLTTAENLESVGHMNVDIWGIYVFGLPVFSGSSAQEGRCAIFNDTVNTNNALALLTKEAQAKLNGKFVTDVVSKRSSCWIFPTLIFFYRDVQMSGNVLK